MEIMGDNDEIINNIREIYKTAPAHKIHQLIAKHFIPSLEEKKENAEIPTPIALVDEMLDKIPIEFWKTPKRVIEPCCGKGNFVMKIFEKFFNGLVELYPDETKRCAVIIKECLYYADLTPMNVFITTEILKCEIQSRCDGVINYNFNKYTGDTLEVDIKKEFNVDNFDAVIGNPPYNSSGNTVTGNTIWQDFTRKGLNELLCENGLLLFVHPPGWRKPNTEKGKFFGMFEEMTQKNQMLYLEIHNIKDGQRVFKCGTRYDWYLIEHTKKYKNTIVIDEYNNKSEIDLSVFKWLPNSNILIIKNMMIVGNEKKCDIMYDITSYGADKKDRVKANQSIDFKYPLIHSTPKKGIRYMYSNVNDRGHFGTPKVIFGDSGINNPVIDIDGKYGMTQHAMGIKINTLIEGEQLSKALQSNKFNNIIQSCSYSSYAIDWNIFKEFKKDFWKEFINDEPVVVINKNKLEIIKNGRSNYYLIENKLYKIKKDKTQGEYYSDYIDGEIIIVDNIPKEKIIKEENNEEKKPKKIIKKKIKNDE